VKKQRANRNRTLSLDTTEIPGLQKKLLFPAGEPLTATDIRDKTICSTFEDCISLLPRAFIDLLVIDPPYNLDKNFHGTTFHHQPHAEYRQYVETWFTALLPLLKPTASVYVCCDWKSSAAVFEVLNQHVIIRNRITWQREKGRGAAANWKNSLEDIWFATISNTYTFNINAVKTCRRVIAPYRQDGKPKDWNETPEGKFRLTCPSNFWDDISIPYWSMPENTDHPTQKPEKLLAKLILASSHPGDMVFDPFLGSGTTSVVAKKLARHYSGIEMNNEYCLWAEKRLQRSETDSLIQGYSQGVFWERNTQAYQNRKHTCVTVATVTDEI
jgi:site-specific DNA-methyltransferase (adenine-specific)